MDAIEATDEDVDMLLSWVLLPLPSTLSLSLSCNTFGLLTLFDSDEFDTKRCKLYQFAATNRKKVVISVIPQRMSSTVPRGG
jgi:hypothetical protein